MQDTDAPEHLFSAVVLSFNSRRYIETCIRTLAQSFARYSEPCEILVVENGSTDGSATLLRNLTEAYPDVLKPIYSETNLGTTVSRNKAIAQAKGRYILVLDSDATIDSHALDILRATLDANPDVGLIVPKLLYPDGRFQISADQFPTIPHKLKRFFVLRRMEEEATAPTSTQDIDYAISACWLLPRHVFNRVGLLDENIFYSPEDVDFCVRIWMAGYRILYEPSATAIHDAQELSRGHRVGGFTIRHVKGLVYYFLKHRYCFSRERLAKRFPIPVKSDLA